MDKPTILAIESSCDDTSAALLRGDRILSNVIASQKVHEQYGGVVPELASRAHQQNIVPVVDAALKNAGVQSEDIRAVAFTRGPGLLGSLMVGVSFAKGFAQSLNIPLIEVNHLQAHVLSLGGAGMNLLSGHAFCISCSIPLSVATINSFSTLSTAYFNSAAVEPTTSAIFTTGPLHSG